ncbi:MAG: hypothetical protein GYA50_01455 [Eubacteriaceae bacterium]|nr:hypothetical protein [Eubacteriaceae bacterium]
MREIDRTAEFLTRDSQQLDEFIAKHDFFILKTASKTAKRYICKEDDEYSVALYAFYDAINKYDYSKGTFYSFAELIINRNIIDYYRAKGKYSAEVGIEEIEENAIYTENDNMLKLEIDAISKILKKYGFSFIDLAKCSPKAEKTKLSCKAAVNYLLDNPSLIQEMRSNKQLPIKIITVEANIPRKILERHRKYIIAAVEIFAGEYMGIAQYLNCLREGVKYR